MNLFVQYLTFVPLLFCIGCSADPSSIEIAFERYLQIDIPSDFEVVTNQERGIIDFTRTYEIKVSRVEMSDLIERIDLGEWELFKETVYRRTIKVNDLEQVNLGIDTTSSILSYDHLYE